jgi:phenylacetate-coenzyme A ligase PaaK-like adenylate-forming protein
MIADVFHHLRLVASVVFGAPFDVRSLERLVDILRETRREFGAISAAGGELIQGPALDAQSRREMELRRFRGQARHAADETRFYGSLFDRLGLRPGTLSWDTLCRIPLTKKEALRADPDAFVRRSRRAERRFTTTGTTGQATTTYFSEHEIRSYVGLGAISLLTSGAITDEDVVQLSTSGRAALGNTCFVGACAQVGALVHLAGLVDPAHTLALLAERSRIPGKKPQVSVLNTYPSHLGELVEQGLAEGRGPTDFGLERIFTGGEIVSAGLKDRARRLFGDVAFTEGYGMTEIWPLGGTLCPQQHLHVEPLHGLVEVIDPDTAQPAGPGQAGTIVATPFAPYRQTMPLLRYDTEDVVRVLETAPTCHLRHLPATSHLLGKLRLSARHENGRTFPREVIEALETLEEVPLPARCGFWAVAGGVDVEVVARADTPAVRRAIERSLEEQGVPVQSLTILEDRRQLRQPLPWRCDLREAAFGPAASDAGTVGRRDTPSIDGGDTPQTQWLGGVSRPVLDGIGADGHAEIRAPAACREA